MKPNLIDPRMSRKIAGAVFLFASLPGLIANKGQLQSADLMWTFFAGVLAFITGVYLLLTREPEFRNRGLVALSEHERIDLKTWHTWVAGTFVFFWILFAFSFVPAYRYIFLPAAVAVGIHGIYLQFARRCPNCGYRITYYRQLSLPETCPSCGIRFREPRVD